MPDDLRKMQDDWTAIFVANQQERINELLRDGYYVISATIRKEFIVAIVKKTNVIKLGPFIGSVGYTMFGHTVKETIDEAVQYVLSRWPHMNEEPRPAHGAPTVVKVWSI